MFVTAVAIQCAKREEEQRSRNDSGVQNVGEEGEFDAREHSPGKHDGMVR